jgi:uncharacterized OB-fold protein
MTDPSSVPVRLTLDYAHGLGGLAPYFAALRHGRALASACPRCGKAWCPPRLLCPQDHCETGWLELAGTGTLLWATRTTTTLPLRTQSATHVFGLVRLDGAENAMTARLGIAADAARRGLRMRLVVAPGVAPHPAQAAWFVPTEIGP